MGNQKEFIASVEKLKKEIDFACKFAIDINADRLNKLETIEVLNTRLSIYEKAIKRISIQLKSYESKQNNIEHIYDTIIDVARESIKKAAQKEDKQ
jgi:hypothetical protein